MELISQPALQELYQAYGLYAVFFFILLESMGIPMPGETILIAAGIYAGASNRISVASLVATAASAAIVGDNLGYFVGRSIGQESIRKYGRHVRLDERRIRLGRYLFLRQGDKIVFFGRFVAVLRAFAALLAGANQMAWPRFLAMNALGGICWATLIGVSSYFFGERIERMAAPVGMAVLLGVLLLIIATVMYARRYEAQLQDLADRLCRDPQ